MVFDATFNNITDMSRRSVLLVEQTGVHGENPPTCRKSRTNFITVKCKPLMYMFGTGIFSE